MSLRKWLRNLRSSRLAKPSERQHRQQDLKRVSAWRPSLEVLEDRRVPATYGVTDLGLLSASDLNESGQVVGYAVNADGFGHAFLWEDGIMIDLGTLGGSYSYADGINDVGQVVGSSNLPGDTSSHAFLINPQDGVWFQDSDLDGRNDLMIDLGAIDESDYSQATDINNAGQVVGGTSVVDASSGNYHNRAFIWDAANGMIDLGAPSSFTESYAYAINEAGQVTGQASYIDDQSMWHTSSFLWDATNGMTALGAGPDYTDSYAVAINDAGQLAGVQWNAVFQIDPAFLWTPDSSNGQTGSFTDLGMLPGGNDSGANDINDAGQVVGWSTVVEWVYVCDYYCDGWDCYEYCYYQDVYIPHAIVWNAEDGMVDLQSQLLPGFDVTLQYAQAINDAGSIIASGYTSSGEYRNYLLTPTPPGTPLIRIDDAPTVTEGNAGTRAATFTVTLSESSEQTVTVDFTTTAGSAAAGSDYQTHVGTLTFAPGETSTTITVLVNGDRLAESSETFALNLSNPTNALISDGHGVGTIIDDEPRISISDSPVKEGNTGSVSATFTVTLSHTYEEDVVVPYTTANGSALAGSDYTAASGTVTIAAGQISNTFTILVTGDRVPEPTETFSVNLGNPTNAVIVDGQGLGTITDDEPRLTITDVSKVEGKQRKTTQFTFTVTLSEVYDEPVTVSYRTVDNSAKAGEDYIGKTGTITFAPGETTQTITIEVKGDNKREASESFYVDLFGNSGNSLFTKNRGLGTIRNDD